MFPSWFGGLLLVIIVLIVALSFLGFQAGPRLFEERENIVANILRAGAPEILPIGNVGGTADDVCFVGAFETLPTLTSGVACANKRSCNKIFEVTATKGASAGGAALELRPEALYAGLGRQLCKFSLSGREWCTGRLGKDLKIQYLAASSDYTCGTFYPTEFRDGVSIDHTERSRTFCARNSDGTVILTTKEFVPVLKSPAVLGNSVHVFARDVLGRVILNRYELDKVKVKKDARPSVAESTVYDISAPATGSDKYLCYNSAQNVLQCLTEAGALPAISAPGKIVAGRLSGDELPYAQLSAGKWSVGVKNLKTGAVTQIKGQLDYEPGAIVLSNKYACFRKGNTKDYVCFDRPEHVQLTISTPLGVTLEGFSAMDGELLLPYVSGHIFSINLDEIRDSPSKSIDLNVENPATVCQATVYGPQSDIYALDAGGSAARPSALLLSR